MSVDPTLVGAFVLGLFGSVHCVGMCGGIAAALGGASPAGTASPRIARQLGYGLGRIGSYAVAGALVGALGLGIASLVGPGTSLALRIAAGLFLVTAGLYIGGWWLGLATLERFGTRLWNPISRVGTWAGLRPADRVWKIVALGMIWGWLPCGLVYAALAGAMATGGALGGAAWMACFGLGTLPALLLVGGLSASLSTIVRRSATRRVAATLMIGFGVWTIGGAVGMSGHGASQHAHGSPAVPSAHVHTTHVDPVD